MSSAYHPQSDGQTKRVNQSVESFLRCFIQSCPSKWSNWLHLAEFWYSTNYHYALNKLHLNYFMVMALDILTLKGLIHVHV